MTKTKQRKAFLAAIAANPREQAPRLIYADWLLDRGEEDEARRQVLKARQCLRFDPEFDYDTFLNGIAFPTRTRDPNGVAVEVLGGGEIIRLALGTEDDGVTVYCEPAKLQRWLRELAEDDDDTWAVEFWWEHVWGGMPGLEQPTKAMLKRAFEASDGPEYYLLDDTSEDWAGSRPAGIVRQVGPGYWVQKERGRYELLDQEGFDGLEGDGFLCSKEEYEEARDEDGGAED
jgi:uncharacterized protein (TIGR02996 family)